MADLVSITVDGVPVEVPKGSLVIEAAGQMGIDVPRFCYHPKLSAVGMCRMCLGEVGMPKMNPDKTPALNEDGTPQIAMMPKPQTLCTTQAAPGMVVLTETPAVIKMREGVLEFFLANHPLDCPICDKGGECMLQDQSMLYATPDSRVKDMYHLRKDLEKNYKLSDLITLDRERCIQCARCTRFQDEIAVDNVLVLSQRGSRTQIDTISEPAFDSKFSGNTIDICPVGALTSRQFRFKARVWETVNVPTISMADGCGTNIQVGTRNETFIRVIPHDNEAINECWISDKDRFGHDWVDSEARLTQPLVRRGRELSPATWDEALQLVADKLKEAGSATGAVGGPKLTNEAAAAMAHLFKNVVGTQNVDCEWQPSLQNPGVLPANFYEELEKADVILCVGANPNETLPILDLRLKKAATQGKAHLINAHFLKTSLDKVAKQSFLLEAGTEGAFINGLSKLVHQSWETDLLAEREGGKAWAETLLPFSSGQVAESAGIAEGELKSAAEAITKAERLFLLIGHDAAPATLHALQNLALLKNRADFLAVLQPEANFSGVSRAGLTPDKAGLNGAAMLRAAADGQLKALFLAATDPFNSAADYDLAVRALENSPFTVVQTLFPNELALYADVVLPAASYMEQDGTTTNFAGQTQDLKLVFAPRERRNEEGDTLSSCAPDWMIFAKLMLLLGAEDVSKTVQGWTQRVANAPAALTKTPNFAPVMDEATLQPAPDGHLRLLWGPLLYDGGESFNYCERLNKVVPAPFALLNRNDARKLNIQNGGQLELRAPGGRALVKAKVGRNVKEGTVYIPSRLRDVQVNRLAPGAKIGGAPVWVSVFQIAAPASEAGTPPHITEKTLLGQPNAVQALEVEK